MLLALATFVLSLGPEITTMGRPVRGTAPYAFFYWHVTGFDGLRVPARYGMLTMMFLATAAGFGAASLEKGAGRVFARSKKEPGPFLLVLVGLLVVAESFAAPVVVNGTEPEADYAQPPPRVFTADRVPAVYKFLKTLPAGTVVVEFPLGQWTYELRYDFYSTSHWHPLVNGYSGTFPLSYELHAGILRHPEERPDLAWSMLADSGATHAIVHESFYKEGRGKAISQWLANHGARLVTEFDGDKIFSLR